MKNNIRITSHPILEINRKKRILFQFNKRDITAYEGETIAVALYASGVRIFSRSFKYHRPRGLFCMAGHCSNCLMRVDGIPNVRVCREPVRPGAVVTSQNAWPSLRFDLAALTDYLSFLVRPGFQYRRFIRARWAYHIWEKFLRRMAGIGSLADIEPAPPVKRRAATPEIVVVGGGTAGLSAALHAAQTGAEVWMERYSVESAPGFGVNANETSITDGVATKSSGGTCPASTNRLRSAPQASQNTSLFRFSRKSQPHDPQNGNVSVSTITPPSLRAKFP